MRRNMPPHCKQLYPNIVLIVDCSNFFIETPSSLEGSLNPTQTIKINLLLSITPCESISCVLGVKVPNKNLKQLLKL